VPIVFLGAVFLGALALAGASQLAPGRLPDLSAFDADIEAVAREFRLDADLLRGMVAAESSGRPEAVSRAGARGLLQLLPSTAREQARLLGLPEPTDQDLDDPPLNLRLGAAYFARLLARFDGAEAFAVAAYNAGPAPVQRWRGSDRPGDPVEVVLREGYEETRRHLIRVLRFREQYRAD
jgi:soluble lytic murein transglycosylase